MKLYTNLTVLVVLYAQANILP